MEVAKNMDSVFATTMSDESDFDVMFDQEDSLIDTVNGVNEAGDPLTGVDFEDLHQTQDDATADDVREGEADDNDMGNKNAEGTKEQKPDCTCVKGELDKESDADKLYGDSEKEYQDDKNAKLNSDPEEINSIIDKVIESVDEDDDTDIDDMMMADDDDPVDEGCSKTKHESTEEDIDDIADDDDTVDEGCSKTKHEAASVDETDINKEIDDAESTKTEENDGRDDSLTKEAKGSFVDSIEDEIMKSTKAVDEAGEVDSDVAKVDDSDFVEDDDLIDAAMGQESEDQVADDLAYDPSDEDLIDMAMNDEF